MKVAQAGKMRSGRGWKSAQFMRLCHAYGNVYRYSIDLGDAMAALSASIFSAKSGPQVNKRSRMIDTDTPTIADIRAARESAEAEIMAVIERFRRLTGLCIIGCEVRNVEIRSCAYKRPDVIAIGVDLTTERI